MNCDFYRNDFRLLARYKLMQACDNRADATVIESLGVWVKRLTPDLIQNAPVTAKTARVIPYKTSPNSGPSRNPIGPVVK